MCLTLQQQISGARQHRYPDTKMKEFERKVEELEKEYKRYAGISQWRQVFLLSHSGSEDRSPNYWLINMSDKKVVQAQILINFLDWGFSFIIYTQSFTEWDLGTRYCKIERGIVTVVKTMIYTGDLWNATYSSPFKEKGCLHLSHVTPCFIGFKHSSQLFNADWQVCKESLRVRSKYNRYTMATKRVYQ